VAAGVRDGFLGPDLPHGSQVRVLPSMASRDHPICPMEAERIHRLVIGHAITVVPTADAFCVCEENVLAG
jgi:hypothetical protein